MDKAVLLRGSVAPLNAPVLAGTAILPAVPLQPDVQQMANLLTDQSFDNVYRMQKYFYALKNGGLLPYLDHFGGDFKNRADCHLNLAGGTSPISYAMEWDATLGFHSTGRIAVTVVPVAGTKTFTMANAAAIPLRVGMGIEVTGSTIPTGSYLTSVPDGGGAGAYTFDNADGLPATASASVGGYVGSFMTTITPVEGVTKYQKDSAHIAFRLTQGANNGGQTSDPFIGRMPKAGAVVDALRIRVGSAGNDVFRSNNSSSSLTITPDIPADGILIFNRVSASRVEIWRNGILVYENDAAPSSALPTLIAWGRANAVFQNIGWKAFSHGAGLPTATLVRALYRALGAI